MPEVFQMMTANMSLNEKLNVVALLKQMNEFHENRPKQNKRSFYEFCRSSPTIRPSTSTSLRGRWAFYLMF
jgi:hypothetical protein